jgi:hypothetical protein
MHEARSRKTSEAQLPHCFCFNQRIDCAVDPLRDQDLLAIRFVTETRGKIRHRADGGVIEAPFKTDFAQCGISLRNTYANLLSDHETLP